MTTGGIATRGTSRTSGSLGVALLCLALILSAIIGLRGITDEAAVSLQGDMPRYLMDGVFLRDTLTADHGWSLHGLLDFAQHYYVQYPAISIGHHPPLLPMMLAPAFAVFGISVEVGRVVILACFLLSVVLLYTFVRRVYDSATAGWTCVLFATMPYLSTFGQSVLSEMVAIAMVLAAMNALLRFREAGRLRDYVLLMACVAASLAARQLAIFLVPAYAVLLVQDNGWRRLIQRRILIPTVITLAGLAIIGIATLALSPFNVALVRGVLTSSTHGPAWLPLLQVIAREQLNPWLLALAAGGVTWSVAARDRRVVYALVWIASVLAGVLFVTGPLEPPRYSILAVPAYCLAAASLWARIRNRTALVAVTAALLATIGWQSASALAVRPAGAHGYEDAALYVTQHGEAPTVLYTGIVDTGYFVFFVRKHDLSQRLVVLRSDKIFTTSQMQHLSVENRISDPSEIYAALKKYGTRYVVIEDMPSGDRVIDWLRNEAHGPHFAERQRFPIRSSDRRLRNADLVVYEYLDATPPAAGAEIDVKLPVVGREIRLPLSDFRAGDDPTAGSGRQ